MAVWYVRDNAPTSTVGWSAVTAWSNHTAVAGELVRQTGTPTVGNERVFVAIVGGATGAVEPTWTVTKGAKNTSSSATYQECTGQPAVNGDLTNTPLSSSVRSTTPALGKIIKDNGGTHIFICSTSGACGAGEPTYVTTAVGNTTTDSSCTWTYIGTSFSVWAAPHARLSNALATNWGAAGDSFYLRSDHAETQSTALTLTSPGTVANPCFVYSVNDSGSLPTTTLLAGAAITTTGNSFLSFGGSGYFHGLTASCGSGSVLAALSLATTTGSWQRFDSCALSKAGTSGINGAITHSAASRLELVNTTLSFGAIGDSIALSGGPFTWRNTASAIAGAVFPTTLLTSASSVSGSALILEGVDLSALGSGKTIVGAATEQVIYYLNDCKLGSSVTIAATPNTPGGAKTYVTRCDSAGTNYAEAAYLYEGTLTQETTIVRTGGASDGTTPLSWKIVTTANSKWPLPFECFPISIWNDVITPTARTVTVYGIWGGGAVPNTDDIWIDVEYLGASGSPLASLATSTKANNLATGSPLSSDSSTWGGSTTKFKMTAIFTAQLAGYIRVYVKAAAASSTFYIDPGPVLS